MSDEEMLLPHRAQIASLTPGRIRIKLHPANRDLPVMQKIKVGLEAKEGVHSVRINPTNGSVTVSYDHRRHSTSGIMGLLEDLDVVLESVVRMVAFENDEAGTAKSGEAGFIAAVDDLNRRIHGTIGVPIDLKILLPLSFVGAAAWSIGKKGLMIESVPGWLFLWLAFDMFVKFYPIQPQAKADAAAAKT